MVCVSDCKDCPALVESRSQIVNGVGPENADLLFIGEAPGQSEDEKGEPFVGQSGTELDKAFNESGISREDVRITNTVRCRPPENRDPTSEEQENCFRHLQEEILSVDPDLIIPIGKVPAQQLLDRKVLVTQETGDFETVTYEEKEYKLLICLHPASLLYNRSLKEKFYNTIQKAVEYSSETGFIDS